MLSGKRRIVAVLGPAVVAVVAATAIAAGASGNPFSHHAREVRGFKHAPGQAQRELASITARQSHATALDRRLVRTFSILRSRHERARTASPSSAVEAALAPFVEAGRTWGADPTQAKQALVGPGNARVWLVPGSAGACLADVEGPGAEGAVCNNTAAVDSGLLWILDTIPYGAGGAMTRVLVGTAPDQNSAITISWSDGGTTVVPVQDSIYVVPIGSHAGWTSVALKNASGHTVAVSGMSRAP